MLWGLKKTLSSIPDSVFKKKDLQVYLVQSVQMRTDSSIKSLQNKKAKVFSEISIIKSVSFINKVKKLVLGSDFIEAARLVSDYGLAHSLAKMSFDIGFQTDTNLDPFEERFYELILAIPKDSSSQFEKKLKTLNLDYLYLGQTGGSTLTYSSFIKLDIKELKKNYNTGLKKVVLKDASSV